MEFRYPKNYASPGHLRSLAETFLRCLVKVVEEGRPVILIAYGYGSLLVELATMLWYNQQLQGSEPLIAIAPGPPEATTTGGVPANYPPQTSGDKANTLEAHSKDPLRQNKPITVTESGPKADVVDSKGNKSLPKLRTGDNGTGGKPAVSDPEGAVSGLGAISAGRLSFVLPNIDVLAGIVLLGTPSNTPMVSLELPNGQKNKDELPTELLLKGCLNMHTFTDAPAYDENSVYHACFKSIVNEIGIPTQFYWGSSKVSPEAGRPFKVSCVHPALLPCDGILGSQYIHFRFARKLLQNVNRP